MANTGSWVEIPVADIEAALVDFTTLRLYRGASQAGPFTTLVTSFALVAGKTAYGYQDTAALATDWYQYELYNSNTAASSERSRPFPAAGVPIHSRLTLRRRLCDRLELFGRPRQQHAFPGPSGTTTAAGTTSSVVCAQYANTRFSDADFVGWSMLATSGAAVDQEREVGTFTPATGTFGMAQAFAIAPGNGATFDLYGEAPSWWWNERLNEAMLDIWVAVQVPVTGVLNQREYVLPDFVESSRQVIGAGRRTGTTLRQYGYGAGAGLQLVERDGQVTWIAPSGLGANAVWMLEIYRHPDELLADTDTIALSDPLLDLLVTGAAAKAAARLAQGIGDAGGDTRRWQTRADRLEVERQAKADSAQMWSVGRSPRQDPEIFVGGERW